MCMWHDDADLVDRRTSLAIMAGAGAAAFFGTAAPTRAQTPAAVNAPVRATDITARLQQLSPNVYAYMQREAPGQTNTFLSNCGIVAGPEQLLAIDTTASAIQAQRFLAAGRAATSKPFGRVVLSHHHLDHVTGNQYFEGAEIVAHADTAKMMFGELGHAVRPITWAPLPNWADGTEAFKLTLPTSTYTGEIAYEYGKTRVVLIHPGHAHTIDDTIVYLPQEKLMFAGDIAFFGVTPSNGSGYTQAWIEAANRILAMDVTTIVPGHGPIGGKAELADMRDYLMLVYREGKKRFASGMSAGRAAADIDLGKYANWTDPDRIIGNVVRLYSELDGTVTPDMPDRATMARARQEYKEAKGS